MKVSIKAAEKYGSVYTPDDLANFVALLIDSEVDQEVGQLTVLDPACGELSLIRAASNSELNAKTKQYIGIDFDCEAISKCKEISNEIDIPLLLIESDFICPKGSRSSTVKWWSKKGVAPDVVISNPPWSGEKIYTQQQLKKAGITLAEGQYDSYLLFIEMCMNLLREGGIAGFILPDSIFSASNESLRRYIASNFQISLVARLGEKLFPEVHRATTVLVLKKAKPLPDSKTKCFRLNTQARKAILKGKASFFDAYAKEHHEVDQSRFLKDAACNFDIDTYAGEESLIQLICSKSTEGKEIFTFSRGVEISKSGLLARCPNCGNHQGVTTRQMNSSSTKCKNCGSNFGPDSYITAISSDASKEAARIIVGEDMARYELRGTRFIQTGLKGVAYKNPQIYQQPKILVRKTGLGINAAFDNSETMVTQTVYMLSFRNGSKDETLYWYYLAVLNSRIVFYLYLKRFGELEWKSHPYLTKATLLSLPLLDHERVPSSDFNAIAELGKKLQESYSHEDDVRLERLLAKAYGLDSEQLDIIRSEMNKMPDLSSINRMKY